MKNLNKKKHKTKTAYDTANISFLKKINTIFFRQKYISQTIIFVLLLTNCTSPQGLISFKKSGKYGFKYFDGKECIKPEYDDIDEDFISGNISVKKNLKWGIINMRGKLISEIKYDNISDFSKEGIASARLNGLFGFIDKTGKEIIPFVYESTWEFQNGIARVKKNGKWGFINIKGEIIIPIEYDDFDCACWSEGLIGACKNHKWGFIDHENKNKIPFNYRQVKAFSEGLAMVSESLGWGFIDQDNNKVIPFVYSYANSSEGDISGFKNGTAQVSLNGKSGYINKKDSIVIPIKYFCINKFYKGYAFAETDNGENNISEKHKIIKYGYVDSIGNEYFENYKDFENYDWNVSSAPTEIPDFSDTLKFTVQQDRMVNMLVSTDSTGILVYEYDTITGTFAYDTIFNGDTPNFIPTIKENRFIYLGHNTFYMFKCKRIMLDNSID